MPFTCSRAIEEAEWEDEGQVGERFAVPGAAHDDDAQVEDAEAAVRSPDPAPGPLDPALVLPCAPDEERGDEAAHQGDFFGCFDHPVDAAAEAGAIFAGAEEEQVDEEGVPEGEEEDEEHVEAAAGEEVQVLASEGGFEDEEVEVDLRWGGGQGGERVGGWSGLAGAGREVRYWGCRRGFDAGGRVAFDYLVEARLGCHAGGGGGGLGLDYRGAMDEGEGLFLHVLQCVCVAIESVLCRWVCSIVSAGRESSVASQCHMRMELVTTLLQLSEAGSRLRALIQGRHRGVWPGLMHFFSPSTGCRRMFKDALVSLIINQTMN